MKQYPDADRLLGRPLAAIGTSVRRPPDESSGDSLSSLKEGLAHHGRNLPAEDVPEYVVVVMRLVGLLHDLGHGPFSHLMEEVTRPAGGEKPRFHHEQKTAEILTKWLTRNTSSHGGPFLEQADADLIAAILTGKGLSTELLFLHQIISSALDADKMDYIVRDAHHTGAVEYGTIDLDRIMDGLVVADKKLCYSTDSLDSLINALNAMFFMYNNVYLHKTVRAFDVAIQDDMRKIGDEIAQLLSNEEKFLELDDVGFIAWVRDQTRITKGLFERDPATYGEQNTRWSQAAAGIEAFRLRRKRYRPWVDLKMAYPVMAKPSQELYTKAVQDLKVQLQPILEAWAEKHKLPKTSFRLDLEKNIRPIGLKLEDVLQSIMGEIVFDRRARRTKSILEYEPYYKTLLRVVVPVRVFGPRDSNPEAQAALEKDFRAILKESEEDAQTRLSRASTRF